MTAVSKFKENRIWIIAYLVISLGFAGYLSYFYSFVIDWSKEMEARERRKPENVKADQRGNFWDYVKTNSKALSAAKDEKDPAYQKTLGILKEINPEIHLLLGGMREDRREFLFYTDLCKSKDELNNSCSQCLNLVEMSMDKDIQHLEIGLAQHAPDEHVEVIHYRRDIDPAKIKYLLKPTQQGLKLIIFNDDLFREKTWAEQFMNAHSNITPSIRFLDMSLGERVFSNLADWEIKEERDKEFKNAKPCRPTEKLRKDLSDSLKLEPLKPVSADQHTYFKMKIDASWDRIVGWFKHMNEKRYHLDKVEPGQ